MEWNLTRKSEGETFNIIGTAPDDDGDLSVPPDVDVQLQAAEKAAAALAAAFDGDVKVSISGRTNPDRQPGVNDPTGQRTIGSEQITVMVSTIPVPVEELPPLEDARVADVAQVTE